MKMIGKILVGVIQFVVILILLLVGLASVFILGKINQPMELPNAHGMTYRQLIENRLNGYQQNQEKFHYNTVTGCVVPDVFGLGYAAYLSSWYTFAGLEPKSQMAKMIPPVDFQRGFVPQDISWREAPNAWWITFEKLSWFGLVEGNSHTTVKACKLLAPE
jgi:hypothetical protein